MAKVFLSHSSKDRRLIDAIKASIGPRHELFLDHDPEVGIQAGAEWERTLYERLRWADAVICVVTANHIASHWCFAEVAIAKAQGRLLLPLGAEAGVRHPLLEPTQGLDYAVDPTGVMERIDQRLAALDAAGGLAWDPTRPVFPGLSAFDIEDRAMFFGRDAQVNQLAAELRARDTQREPRAVLVVGGSGSGKSSLVRAGLVARLLDDPKWWRLRPIVPGRNPLRALAAELARARKEVGHTSGLDGLTYRLAQNTGELSSIATDLLVSAPGDRRRLLVVVDQLEEVFTRAARDDRTLFLRVLADAVSDPDSPVAVVATLRSEFLTQLLNAPEAARLRERPFVLPPLGREHLEEVIARPAEKAGIKLDDDLLRLLVHDTGSGEALPLLAFTLARLVDGLRPGERVDLARYHQVGGVQGALIAQAEKALTAAVKAAACSEAEVMTALLAFVTLDDDGRPARRRRRRADLDDTAPAIADCFVEARLLTSDADEAGTSLAVAHETLFSAWPRLSDAIKQATAALQFRRSLERESAEWEREGRPASSLWRGERLARTRALVEQQGGLGPLAKAFVQASLQGETEAAQRESLMLVDRVLTAGVSGTDSELALLYLLAAIDEYATTPDAVAALRLTLALHRLAGRVGPLEQSATAAAISDDGELVAVADRGTNTQELPSTRRRPPRPAGAVSVSLWRLGESLPRWSVPFAGRSVRAIAWSRDGGTIAAGVDTRVVFVDALSGACRQIIEVGSPIESLELAPGGRQVLVGIRGGQKRLLDESRHWTVPDVPPEPTELTSLFGDPPAPVPCPNPHSRIIQCPYASRVLNLIGSTVDIWAADPVDRPIAVDATGIGEVSWVLVPEANHPGALLAGDPGGRFRCAGQPPSLIEEASGTQRRLSWGFAVAASFSGDGRRLALATYTDLAVIDTETMALVAEFGHHNDPEGDTYTSVALNQDGTVLASGSLGGGRSCLWTVATGQPGMRIGGRWVAFSPDGNSVATSAMFASFVLDLKTGYKLQLGQPTAYCFAFSPDGSALVAAQKDGGVEYSLPDANAAAHYPGPIEAIAFTSDGRHVLTRANGQILRWPDRTPQAVISRARAVVFRQLTGEERARFELLPKP